MIYTFCVPEKILNDGIKKLDKKGNLFANGPLKIKYKLTEASITEVQAKSICPSQ